VDVDILGTLANTAVWVARIAVGLEVVGVWVAEAGVGTGSGALARCAGALVVGLAGNIGFFTIRDAANN